MRTWPDGRRYQGEFMEGEMHGFGEHTFPSGEKYTGQFSDNLREGEGTLGLAEGGLYEGGFSRNKFHGKGRLITREGGSSTGSSSRGNSRGQVRSTGPTARPTLGARPTRARTARARTMTWTQASRSQGNSGTTRQSGCRPGSRQPTTKGTRMTSWCAWLEALRPASASSLSEAPARKSLPRMIPRARRRYSTMKTCR